MIAALRRNGGDAIGQAFSFVSWEDSKFRDFTFEEVDPLAEGFERCWAKLLWEVLAEGDLDGGHFSGSLYF